MPNFKSRKVSDVLHELKEIEFALNQVSSDKIESVPAAFLNKAKNILSNLIADGQRRLDEKLYKRDGRFEGAAGPDWTEHERDRI
jgi:hypothetical protein